MAGVREGEKMLQKTELSPQDVASKVQDGSALSSVVLKPPARASSLGTPPA